MKSGADLEEAWRLLTKTTPPIARRFAFVVFFILIIFAVFLAVIFRPNPSPEPCKQMTTNFNEEFSNLENWHFPSQWKINHEIIESSISIGNTLPEDPEYYLYLERSPELGFAKNVCFDNFNLKFIVKLGNKNGAAWALCVQSPQDYYLFNMSGSEEMFYTYVATKDGLREVGKKKLAFEPVADGLYLIIVDVLSNKIKHTIKPLETGSDLDGQEIEIDTFSKAAQFLPGSIGFLTFDSQAFSIYRITASSKEIE